jgi:hypothetical protein
MQAFLGWWRPYRSNHDLDLIRDAGFTWVKQVFAWRDIQGAAKGHFDWQLADEIVFQAHDRYGREILAQVGFPPDWARSEGTMTDPPANLQDWADLLYTFASRYPGRIRAYEVWNEPNLAREWGGRQPDPAAHTGLLRVAYRAIKEADPQAVVVSAGLAQTGTQAGVAIADDQYLEAMYAAMGGDSDLYFDALGVHAMGFKAPPEVSPAEAAPNPEYGSQRFFTFRCVEDLRQIVEVHGDAGKQVVVTELGWTSDPRPDSPYHWHAVTEEQKADYLVRAYGWAEAHWQPWIGPLFVFALADPAWTPVRVIGGLSPIPPVRTGRPGTY